MAGKGRKSARLSGKTSRGNKSDLCKPNGSFEPPEQWAQCDLPIDLLKDIISRLSLRDNIRASAVCKTWRDVSLSTRRAGRPPWLVNLPKNGKLYEFYDPSNRRTYGLDFPELRDSRILYVKDGWWLLFKLTTHQVFFFCPYTLESINMPDLNVSNQVVAFSAPPTSPSCVLFTTRQITASLIAISTCRPGDSAWATIIYENNRLSFSGSWNKVVFCNGIFHCMSLTGLLSVYDHENQTWSIIDLNPPIFTNRFSFQDWLKGKFMAEHNGDIYVSFTSSGVEPTIYKLNKVTPAWEKVQDFGGKTFFASLFSSYIKADLLGKMRNNIYFSKVLYYGKQCVRYSLEDKRYYPRKEGVVWEEHEPFDRIWFEIPAHLTSIQ